MATRIFGSAIKRREDPRLITGQAKYTDDFVLPGMVHLAVVRSPYAHARIKRIDVSAARTLPGVLGVFTGQEMKDAGFSAHPLRLGRPRLGHEDPRLSADRHRPGALRRQRGRDRGGRGPVPRA